MTQPVGSDAVTRGTLQFAIVESFDDDSSNMTGTVCLMNGLILPFAYIDGRFTTRDEDNTPHFEETGNHPGTGYAKMDWPHDGAVLMVDVNEGHIKRWTWPMMVLSDTFIGDRRYLGAPGYGRALPLFPGLHCLVDMTKTVEGQATHLVQNEHLDFPASAVYVGHHADDYLEKAQTPYAFAVFAWHIETNKCRMVSFAAKH